ncbi:MAG: hypothetical protein RLZZ227_3134 [Pseudomonadota bacterium]|jgi:hypothetical protein
MKPGPHSWWIAAGSLIVSPFITVPWTQAYTSPSQSVESVESVESAESAQHRATLDPYCGDCRNTTDWAGSLKLETLETACLLPERGALPLEQSGVKLGAAQRYLPQ